MASSLEKQLTSTFQHQNAIILLLFETFKAFWWGQTSQETSHTHSGALDWKSENQQRK